VGEILKGLMRPGWYISYLRNKGNKKCGTELHFIFRKGESPCIYFLRLPSPPSLLSLLSSFAINFALPLLVRDCSSLKFVKARHFAWLFSWGVMGWPRGFGGIHFWLYETGELMAATRWKRFAFGKGKRFARRGGLLALSVS